MEAPTLGWKVRLVKASPQGINPDIIILDIEARKPDEDSGDQVETHELKYNEDPPGREYKQATIRYERLAFTIDVKVTN